LGAGNDLTGMPIGNRSGKTAVAAMKNHFSRKPQELIAPAEW
jgi:hypothetical protein